MTATQESNRRVWALGLFGAVLVVGTVGYMVLGLTFADAVYQTGITVTTVGYGEITSGEDPTAAYRWFTLGLVLVGASAAVFAAGVIVETVVDRRAGVFRERRMQREIDAMRAHVIVCGYGRVGRAVADRAAGLGGTIVVIDSSPDQLEGCPHPHVQGDATNDDVLRLAGVTDAESLVTTLSSDASNLFVAVSGRRLNGDLRVVSRANEPDNAEKLRAMDLHTVVEPNQMAGARLATAALRPNTSAYLDQVFSADADQVELTEVEVRAGASIDGLELAEMESSCGVIVVAHRPAGESDFSSPRSFAGAVSAGDVLIVLGDRESVDELLRRA
ncbi:MAG: potassium channel family protein [Actinomycetota bacterium]